MSKRVTVKPSAVAAAKLKVKLATRRGATVSKSITKIANAKPVSRSAHNGQVT